MSFLPPATLKGDIKDIQKFQQCKFLDNVFYIVGDSKHPQNSTVEYGIWYNQLPTSTQNQSFNTSDKSKTSNQLLYMVNEDATKFTVEGSVFSLDERKKLESDLKTYNDTYVNNIIKNQKTNKAEKPALQLPTYTIDRVLVLNHKWSILDYSNLVEYRFTATFAAFPSEVKFKIKDPKVNAHNNIFGSQTSLINKAIDHIKKFNLSYYINQGLGAYSYFMQYSGLDDVLSAAQNITNMANLITTMAQSLIGPNGSVVRNVLNNMLNNAEDFVKTPVTMFNNIGKLFGAITSSGGNSTLNKGTFKNIINYSPPNYPSTPNNAIKIINSNSLTALFKASAYISYCNEVTKTTYLTNDQIAEEIKNLQKMYIIIEPFYYIDELNSNKSATISYLQSLPANKYQLREFTVNNIGWIPLLFSWFRRIDPDDELLVRSLNPDLDISNITGTIKLPDLIQ